jgi:site-specific recombinase XerD
VFCDINGAGLTIDMLKRPFERVTAAAGLPAIRHHDMRHSFASQLVVTGLPLKPIQELLGHAEIQMTMR